MRNACGAPSWSDGINIIFYINSLNYCSLAFDWMDWKHAVMIICVTPTFELGISQIQARSVTRPNLGRHVEVVRYFNCIGSKWMPKPKRDFLSQKERSRKLYVRYFKLSLDTSSPISGNSDTAQHIWKRNLRMVHCCANKQTLLVCESYGRTHSSWTVTFTLKHQRKSSTCRHIWTFIHNLNVALRRDQYFLFSFVSVFRHEATPPQ